MMTSAKQIAAQLIENGYQPIPIPHGKKGPIKKGWQHKVFSESDFPDVCNIGIRCGDAQVAFLDIDIYSEDIVSSIVEEWNARFAQRGSVMQRTGRAPKTGILFQTEAGSKKTSQTVRATGNAPLDDEGRPKVELVEVLATGQQFVAYGIHQETGAPYRWHGLDPAVTVSGRAADLPFVSCVEVAEFLAWVAGQFGPEEKALSLSERAKAHTAKRTDFGTDNSVISAFNKSHPLQELLPLYGYKHRHGDHWTSPNSGTGSANVQVIGDRWRSLSGSDEALKIGAQSKSGQSQTGDAFDLFVAYEHGGDFDAALRSFSDDAGFDSSVPEQQAGEVEATPVDLWGSFEPPELPRNLLPKVIEDFAFANGAQMGADPAGLAMAALATCAAAIPDAVKIKVKRHGDWTESARLWVALMGPPSAKKSPIISLASGPLCSLDVEMMRSWQQRLAAYEALSPEDKKGKKRPAQTRLRIEDVTVEAAQQVLEGSPWGVLLLQDELSGFFGAMDRYNGGKAAQADRAFWLRSFNGGEFALNRVSRGAAIIENLSVSMLGGIQPEPLRKIAGDAVDDGLLQRLFPISLRSASVGVDEPMPPVNEEYRSLISSLRAARLVSDTGGTGQLEFDAEGQEIRRTLETRHLELQSLETINRKLASHIGKYDGLFARLCVLWHCIDNVDCEIPLTVAGSTARRVSEFLHRFLLPHSIAFYGGVLGLSDDHDRLTAIAGHILAHKLEKITNRDVQRGDRTMRGLKDFEVRPLLEQLSALGWLDRIDPPRRSSAPHWVVNPLVHERFADRAASENRRRKAAREAIQALVGRSS